MIFFLASIALVSFFRAILIGVGYYKIIRPSPTLEADVTQYVRERDIPRAIRACNRAVEENPLAQGFKDLLYRSKSETDLKDGYDLAMTRVSAADKMTPGRMTFDAIMAFLSSMAFTFAAYFLMDEHDRTAACWFLGVWFMSSAYATRLSAKVFLRLNDAKASFLRLRILLAERLVAEKE